MTACLLLGPPCTAHHLPGSPLAQCPGPLLLLFLLFCFLSGAGGPPLPSFCPWGLPPPPPCAPQSPEFARGPSRRQKVPTATAQTVFANNVTHLVFHHSGMRGCLPYMSVFPSFLLLPSSLPPTLLSSSTSSPSLLVLSVPIHSILYEPCLDPSCFLLALRMQTLGFSFLISNPGPTS